MGDTDVITVPDTEDPEVTIPNARARCLLNQVPTELFAAKKSAEAPMLEQIP